MFLEEHNSGQVARDGELVDVLRRPAIVARRVETIAGVLTYDIVGEECELLTLHCDEQWSGIGTQLLEELVAAARAAGCRRLRVVTTNDNIDALRFYQRRGFRLARLRPGAVDRSRRTLKPGIPDVGLHQIPLRDELELDRPL